MCRSSVIAPMMPTRSPFTFRITHGFDVSSLALAVHDVRRNDRILRYLDKLARLLPTVVEIVITEGCGIEAEQIGYLKHGHPFINGGNRRSLRQIAGAEQNAVDAPFTLMPNRRRHISKSAMMIVERTEPRMQIVRVQNRQRPDFCGKLKRENGQNKKAKNLPRSVDFIISRIRIPADTRRRRESSPRGAE